jgi:hypothetical protein
VFAGTVGSTSASGWPRTVDVPTMVGRVYQDL